MKTKLLFSLLFVLSFKTLFSQIIDDNFDSETVGTLPTGWVIRYDGSGSANQQVVNTTSVSPTNSFELVSSSLLAQLYKSFSSGANKLSVELSMKSENSLVGQTGYFSLYNTEANNHLSIVQFEDGKIITYFHDGTASPKYIIQDFVVDQWYHIKIEANLLTRKYQVYIDGNLVSGTYDTTTTSEFSMASTDLPNSIILASGNGGVNTMWFDNIKLYETPGLVAYYPFNGNANDESGNANNGIVNGATLTTDRFGNADNAYYFDGIDNHILCSTEIGPFGSNSRTISFWAKTDVIPDSNNQQNSVLSYGGNISVGGSRFEILINPKCRGIGIDVSSKYITKEFDNSDNGWHFYTVVLDNTISTSLYGIKFYADGDLISNVCNSNGDISINTLDEQVLNIGRLFYTSAPRYFKGSIDEIKIYNVALSDEEIKNEATNLIAYYPFNGNANDESGNGNHGTVSGATLTTDRFGNADSAYSFDGSDIITVAHNDILNVSNELSISVWIKPNAIQSAMILGKSNYSNTTNYLLRINTDRFINFEYKNFANSNSLPFTVNDWNHIAVVSQADDSKQVYINGVLATHTSSTSPYGLVTNDLTIGARSGAEFFNGIIDDLRIYKTALTSQEVQNLYTNNSTLKIEQFNTVTENNFYVSNNILYFKNNQNLDEIKNIEIYNMYGQCVFKTSQISNQIIFSNLSTGIYILKVENTNSNYNTLKFIFN